MRSSLWALARQGGIVLTAAAAGGTMYAAAQQQKDFGGPYLRSTTLIPTALAESAAASAEATASRAKVCAERRARTSTIALSGFEAVGDSKAFVETVLGKALKQRDSSLAAAATSPSGPANSPGAQPRTVDTASFYSFYEKQPLDTKVAILDDTIEAVVREAERSAEVGGLAVGMLGGGVACYALAGWWADMALPGLGTVGCTVAAGVSGHNRAKKASRRTRSRLLSAVAASREDGAAPNAFVDYLSAASMDAKQRIASSTRPEAFFNDFYSAVKPILKQVSSGGGEGEGGAAAPGILDVAA